MLQMNAFIEHLAKTDRDRLQDAEKTIEQRGAKVGVVNEVMRDAVDVPGDADRINEAKDEHDPERHSGEQPEHAEEVSAVHQSGDNRDRIPASIGEDPR